LYIWDAQTGTTIRTFSKEDWDWHTDLAWTVDNRIAIANGYGFGTTIDPITGDYIGIKIVVGSPASGGSEGVWSMDLSPDATRMAIGSTFSVSYWLDTTEITEDYQGGFGSGDYVFSVDWNPQGHIIAAAGRRGYIVIADADTGTIMQYVAVSDTEDVDVRSVAWNPDGTRLAYTDTSGNLQFLEPVSHILYDGYLPQRMMTMSAVQPSPGICLRNADGSEVVELINPGSQPTVIDAYRVAYQVGQVEGGRPGLYLFDTRDASTQTVIPAAVVDPDWSRDGTKVAYAQLVSGKYVIRTANADGTNIQTLTATTFNSRYPTWSPDGTKLAFQSDRDGDNEIFIMNANGLGVIQRTTNTAADIQPDWSPDGMTLAFASDQTGNFEIYRMDVNGTGIEQLTHHPADDTNPAWSPDGDAIVFLSNRTAPHATTTATNTLIFMLHLADLSQISQVTPTSATESFGAPEWAYFVKPWPPCPAPPEQCFPPNIFRP